MSSHFFTGTAFLMDGSSQNPSLWKFQKLLAILVGIELLEAAS